MKRMKTFLLSGAVAVGLFAIIGASPALAKKPGGGTTSAACPKGNLANLPTYNDAGAYATPISGGFDYFFISTDQSPSGGVPGLVKYCVYPSDAGDAPDAEAEYGNWIASTSSKSPYNFSFGRDGGNATNVPLDGDNPQKIGTATWADPLDIPESQTIVLHIADPDFCGTSPTCFVKPGLAPGPICDAGDPDVAYNAIPTDFNNGCPPAPSFAFEANQASEFGDGVHLATGGELDTMTVDLQSYGCGTSGAWSTALDGDPDPNVTTPDPCVTSDPNATFDVAVTAHFYNVDPGTGALGSEITNGGSLPHTQTFAIHYRPSADDTNCTNPSTDASDPPDNDTGKWFDAVSGYCVDSLSQPITFTFPDGITLPSDVIWTVSFNTTHYGNPIGESATCFQERKNDTTPPRPPGCGYDSLNVGVKTYLESPYSGSDLDQSGVYQNSAVAAFYCDGGAGGTGTLRLDTAAGCWDGFRPLAEIVTAGP